MFIHWGGLQRDRPDCDGVFHERRPKVDEYTIACLPFFDPEKFDAATWVRVAKATGMKYIRSPRAHKTASLCSTRKFTDWNIVQRTPYKKGHAKDARWMSAIARHQALLLLFATRLGTIPDYFPRGRRTE